MTEDVARCEACEEAGSESMISKHTKSEFRVPLLLSTSGPEVEVVDDKTKLDGEETAKVDRPMCDVSFLLSLSK